jgi:hypothetical protein
MPVDRSSGGRGDQHLLVAEPLERPFPVERETSWRVN